VNPGLEGTSCDEEAARLLPWYVTGRLQGADFERVSSHLQRCAVCRDDLAHERAIRGLLQADDSVEYAPQAGLAKTLSRIDELARDAPAVAPPSRAPAAASRRRTGALQWLTAAVIVQAVAIGWLGTSARHRMEPEAAAGQYQTLSADPLPAAAGMHIRAVFAPGVTLADLKSLLAANSLTVVHGPSDAGAYTLAPTDARASAGQLGTTVAALRMDDRVLFAEPVANDAAVAR
jgi:anti-sigma factor RsiW